MSFDEQKTKAILKKCKANSVSISHVLFAICNIALIRAGGGKSPELPMYVITFLMSLPADCNNHRFHRMMYSALNLRQNLNPSPTNNHSYWFLAIGYYNIILPAFLPAGTDVEKTVWLRAQSVKAQTAKYVKSKMLTGRSLEMSKERGERARRWAAEDDGVAVAAPPKPVADPEPAPPAPKATFNLPPAPSAAIVGLSLLGNLDGMYAHAAFPGVTLHTLTTGSRQRKGGMLLFGYTFVGKLWVSLGWDVNGFDQAVVNAYWQGVLGGIEEFLV